MIVVHQKVTNISEGAFMEARRSTSPNAPIILINAVAWLVQELDARFQSTISLLVYNIVIRHLLYSLT